MGVSIIIPAKNEGEGITRILESIKGYANEIIVVDGHSQDGTKEKVEKFGAKFILDNKKGRGDAVRVAIKAASEDIILFFDADGSHDDKDVLSVLKPLQEGKADMVTCSRRKGGSLDIKMDFPGFIRMVGCDMLAMLINLRWKSDLSDVLYSFRAIKREVILDLNLKADKFYIEQEMIVKALKKKYKIIEIPSREFARGWGNSKLSTFEGIEFFLHFIREALLP
ncbi:MAG: glycosyltransferase [PVC group bacterium]|nr:glycosyltransferase [PVC group bacterium]